MKKKINLLQVYRGIAAFLVVLSHGNHIVSHELNQDGLVQVFHFGWIGVDFFFILSGFIIFYIHQNDIGQPNKFKSFVFKRFIRIYPLYWSILGCKIFASLLSNNQSSFSQRSVGEILKAFLLLPQETSILESSFIGVSWTLSHEILFYCIFSLLILFKTKIIKVIVYTWIIGTIFNFLNLLPIGESFILQFIFDERNLEFVFGYLAAFSVYKYKFKYAVLLISASIFTLILAIINTKYGEYNVLGISPVIAYGISLTLLIIGSVYLEVSNRIQIPQILIYIGNASYSIYLTHGFFLNNISKIFAKLIDKFDILSLIENHKIYYDAIAYLIVLLTVAIGCVIHSYFEKPLITNLRQKVFLKTNQS